MKTYNEQLDELFRKWKKEFEFAHFFHDGLMYRGEIKTENPYWRNSGNEDELWEEAPKRVMFLMKDVNAGGDGLDIDNDIRGRIFRNASSRTYQNMVYWLYGLLKTMESGQVPNFTFSDSEAKHFFDDTPVAYVNCKKEAGTSSVSNSTLNYYIERDKKFIIEEIEILNPDIIVCCAWAESSGNPIFEFVGENVYQDIEQVNSWMYYSKEKKKLIIDSYHPATRKSNDTEIYNNMMADFKEFLDEYPDFLKSCRNT